MLPQLRRLEETYPDDVVVIGVHSPKFPAERDLANVRAAVLALEVDHPVVSDPDHRLWEAYAVRAWPTLMFVDPLGRVIAKQEGELRFPALGDVVGAMLRQFRAEGALGYETALPLRPEPRPTGPLAFPGKVLADEASGRLIVSDSGHHRLIVTRLAGAGEARAIGSGVAGFANGDGAARFNTPQGLALDGETLYVADTTNHAIRRVDLGTGVVSTIVGTGYVSTAAGNGAHGLQDGTGETARLWEPSGLSAAGGKLYVADTNNHAIRVFDPASGDLATLHIDV